MRRMKSGSQDITRDMKIWIGKRNGGDERTQENGGEMTYQDTSHNESIIHGKTARLCESW
jgi:hypothetical protein